MADGAQTPGALTSPRIQWLGRAADAVTCALALGPFAAVLAANPSATQVVAAAIGAAVLAALAVYHLRLVRGGRRVLPVAVTLAPMLMASYGLVPVLGREWLATPAFPLAAVLGQLPRRGAIVAAVLIVAAEPVVCWLAGALDGAAYGTLQVTLSAAALFAFARAVAAAQELARLREELATVAVVSERLRVSRDLHDLLGRSLAAIGLKAELAMRYFEQDAQDRVRRELGEIVELAHQSGADLRELVSGYRRMTLRQEVRASRELLERNAVSCTVDLDALPELPRQVDQVLAWTVREAVTNVLRHSSASRCLIEGVREETHVGLRVRNDGGAVDGAATPVPPAFSTPGAGTGLMGIAERAAALGGSSQARRHRDGWFEVAVRVPLPREAEAEAGAGRTADGDRAPGGLARRAPGGAPGGASGRVSGGDDIEVAGVDGSWGVT